MNNRIIRKVQSWEIDFLNLTYPMDDIKLISEILNRSKRSIEAICRRNNIKRRTYDQIIIGEKYGPLTVLAELNERRKGGRVWLCQCECGIKSKKRTGMLSRHPSCGHLRLDKIKTGFKIISGELFGNIVRCAQYREIPFELDIEDLYNLYLKQKGKCALSGMDLDFEGTRFSLNDKIRNTKRYTASLDRIDSSKGYTIDNIQWVHKDINIMKGKLNEDYFLEICRKINSFQGEKLEYCSSSNQKLIRKS